MRRVELNIAASLVAGCVALAASMTCSAERVTTFMVDNGFAYDGGFRQLVRVQRSDVKWPWFSHGITVSNQRTQRWVAHWRLLDTPPFIEPGEIDKGAWVEGERRGETLLSDGAVVDYAETVSEPDLVRRGYIDRARCAPDGPRRVIYDRARAHFVVFCERGLWLYRLGESEPISRAGNAPLTAYLGDDPWGRNYRFSLSHNTRYLAVWRDDKLPGYLEGKEPARYHEVLVVDTLSGKTTRVAHHFARSARILDAEVDETGTVRTLLCSRDGVAGWTVAVSSGDVVQPIPTPERIRGCSSNDRVVWLPSHHLVLFVRHPNLDGHVSVDANRYDSGQRSRVEWYLP